MIKSTKSYVVISRIMAAIFIIVGLLFLFASQQVIVFFNFLSPFLHLPEAVAYEPSFYHILAVAYMYVVTFLAIMMAKQPKNEAYPLVLANAKLASSILSLAFFLIHKHYLIYLSNFVIDGLICIFVVQMMHCQAKLKRLSWR